ncbi:uridine kinase family protein [Legionella sp. CNM-1927-20]|uniref:uridine kinase family protein n=1 Tax=Legionella sp. CNM-1927-20 TaxID=3422221 RepID=UPI00403A828A
MIIFFIAGPSGGGKSTLAEKLKLEFNCLNLKANILKMDNYYKMNDPSNQRQNFDTPDAIDIDLLVDHLRQLQAGQSIESPLYSFAIKNRLTETSRIEPTDILIVEGIFALMITDLLETPDKLGIYIQPDFYLANVERRASRDITERYTSVEETRRRELKSNVRDGFFSYIARTKGQADIDISNNGEKDISQGVEQIIALYKGKFQNTELNQTMMHLS